MRILAILFGILSVAVLTCVGALKVFARQFDKRVEAAKSALAKVGENAFDPASVQDLPPAARAYLLHAIAPGTPLFASVDLRFGGTIRTAPNAPAQAISAEERLAPGFGYVWKVELSAANVSGVEMYHDGSASIRYVRGGFLPATEEGLDVDRAARARLALESVLLPTSLVPSRGAEWEEGTDQDATHAVVHLVIDREEIDLAIEVDGTGRLVRAMVKRPTLLERGGSFVDLKYVLAPKAERTLLGLTVPSEYRSYYLQGPGGEGKQDVEIEVATTNLLDLAPR